MSYAERAATAYGHGMRLGQRGIDAKAYLRTYSTTAERMAFVAGYSAGQKTREQEWRQMSNG